MNFIATLPTNCAPTFDLKKTSWADCSNNCGKKCTTCTPDPQSDCGQMMIDAGIDCAPPDCVSQCCTHSSPTNLASPPNPSHEDKSVMIGVGVAVLLTLIIFMIMRR